MCVEPVSHWVEILPLKSTSAVDLVEALYSGLFVKWGFPRQIISDCGSNLTSKLMKVMVDTFGIKHMKTSVFHSSCNGLVERHNQTILKTFRLYCKGEQKNWPQYIPGLLYSYRSTCASKVTKLSPFEILLGRKMRLGVDVKYLDNDDLPASAADYVDKLKARLKLTQEIARENNLEAQSKSKQQYDKGKKEPDFEVGDRVLLLRKGRRVGENPKMKPFYEGPFIIEHASPLGSMKLRNVLTGELLKNTRHVDQLKKLIEDEDLFQSKVDEAIERESNCCTGRRHDER